MVYTIEEKRIDSTNVKQFENAILNCRGNSVDIEIDAKKLEYISSAGLRVLLKVRKLQDNLRIFNVNSLIYNIFEMTGYTEICNIEKACKNISIKDCKTIGKGANGIVYRLKDDPDLIVKVFKNLDCIDDINRERELAKLALINGINTAIPFDVVTVDGNMYGLVFELLDADTLINTISKNPDKIDKYIMDSVNMLKNIHSTILESEKIYHIKDSVYGWIEYIKNYIPNIYDKLIAFIDSIPNKKNILHGDYQGKNIMIQNEELILIDMDTLCCGDPIFEFAFLYNSYIGYEECSPSSRNGFLGINKDVSRYIYEKTLSLYLETKDEAILLEYTNKASIIGYIRIIRKLVKCGYLVDSQKKEIVETYINSLIRLVNMLN